MVASDQAAVQSIVFHAIGLRAKALFRAPSRLPQPLFGPRPAELVSTPFHDVAKPLYFSGPDDNARAIVAQLARAVGPGNFEYQVAEGHATNSKARQTRQTKRGSRATSTNSRAAFPMTSPSSILRSSAPLRAMASRSISAFTAGKKRQTGSSRSLNQNKGSTVWDDRFETDQAALDEAMLAIDEEGLHASSSR